jgi:NAD(P)-dependent dehydrogenase (short-subunit alcohol dehydrogenase family)
VKAAIDAFGRLDAVVNNAGFVRDRMFVSSSVDEWDAVLRVHLRGHYCISRHAAAYWRQQGKEGVPVSGRIVNTSSGAGVLGSVAQSAYSTAKGGIASLTLVQAAELGRYHVTANAICPIARTRMTADIFGDMMKRPEDGFDSMDAANVSPLVAWLCSEDAADVTGRVFEVAGDYVQLFDGWRHSAKASAGGRRFEAGEIGSAVRRLVAEASSPEKVYGT